MIKEFEFYHGAALTRLIHANQPVSIKLYPTPSNASYIVNDKVGLYLKYSSNRLTPWRFGFCREHQEEIDAMEKSIGNVVVGLVCSEDGVVGLNYDEFTALVKRIDDGPETICAMRKARQKYTITGSKGKLRYKIGENDFLEKVLHLS